MIIIGLGYKKGSGKDFCADYLVRKHGFRKIAFANPLKEACRSIFSFNDEQLYGSQKETECPYWRFTPRWALQVIGTDLFRDTFGDMLVQKGFCSEEEAQQIWIRCLQREIQLTKPNYKGVVISDVRFENEAQAIRSWGGTTINIVRPSSGDFKTHASEVELDGKTEVWDHQFNNIGDKYIEFFDGLISDLSGRK
jgi:hypothetical protein